MKTIEGLTTEDVIAFNWRYSSADDMHIEVAQITSIQEDDVLVHFLYGYKSIGEYIKKSDIIAIGNNETGEAKLEGWGGKFDLIDRPLFTHDCDRCVFLGTFNGEDLYFHGGGFIDDTLISRFSPNGPDYSSGMAFVGMNKQLTEAHRRAVEKGLIKVSRPKSERWDFDKLDG